MQEKKETIAQKSDNGFRMLHACLSEFDHPVNELTEHILELRSEVEDRPIEGTDVTLFAAVLLPHDQRFASPMAIGLPLTPSVARRCSRQASGSDVVTDSIVKGVIDAELF